MKFNTHTLYLNLSSSNLLVYLGPLAYYPLTFPSLSRH